MNSPTSAPPPNIASSLEDWLESQIAGHLGWFHDRPLLLDVGAYHGDFARRFVNAPASPFRTAILFEPNAENRAALQRDIPSDQRFRAVGKACADRPGSAKLYCQGERYTGSLLPYEGERPGAKTEQEVSVTTVDEFLSEAALGMRAGIIKVDTQGNDLRVLQGAARTLRTDRPWLVVEMLATPRFVNQAWPREIMLFLEQEKYFLAAEMNEYYTATGWLAWYDACFVSQELFRMDALANLPRPTAAGARLRKSSSLRKKLGRIFQAG